MSVEPTDDTNPTAARHSTDEERIAELEAGDGVIIYDRQNHRAWLQSSETVPVTERR